MLKPQAESCLARLYKEKLVVNKRWIKSPHVVTLGILKILDLDSLTIFIGGGGGILE